MPYGVLADAVLVLHFGIVVFIVLGLPLIAAGNRRGWRWVNGWGFRLAHVAAIAVVVLQAWLGRLCPLTTLEATLRTRAGEGTYAGSFVGHWLQRLLFYEAPAWAFVLGYTVFAALVLAAWWRWPPGRRAR